MRIKKFNGFSQKKITISQLHSLAQFLRDDLNSKQELPEGYFLAVGKKTLRAIKKEYKVFKDI